MKRLLASTLLAALAAAASIFGVGGAAAQNLDSFGVLAGSAVTNTGSSVINGNVGVWPQSSISGFPPGLVTNGTIYSATAEPQAAQSEFTARYTALAGQPVTTDLSGQNLGNRTLIAGDYGYTSIAGLTGQLTLDGQGNPFAQFVFHIGTDLTTASASSILLINGAQAANVYFLVGSSATLGTTTAFKGKILALASITLTTGATISCGAAWAQVGTVTLDTNTIGICPLAAGTFGTDSTTVGTENGTAVASAIDAYLAANGFLPPTFQALLDFLTPEERAVVLAQLAGPSATGAGPASARAMGSFLSLLTGQGNGTGPDQGPGNIGPERNPDTVKTLGYAGEPDLRTGLAPFDNGVLAVDVGRWGVWGSAYGGQSHVDGNTSVGSHDTGTNIYGLAGGFDRSVSSNTRVGFSLGAGRTSFDLADGFGGGRSDILQAGIYASSSRGPAYVTGALAYGWNAISTHRSVTAFGITNSFSANYVAHSLGAQIETGYRLGWITPYAALRGQAFYTPAYAEKPGTGALSAFALNYGARTTFQLRSELGARFEKAMAIHDQATLTLRASAAWAHDYWSENNVIAGFQALPGSSFVVQGARPGADSLLLAAGAEVGFRNGFSIAALVDSELAVGGQAYSGSGRLRYVW